MGSGERDWEKATGVSDVLDPENQERAASARLLTRALDTMQEDERPDTKDRLRIYQEAAACWIPPAVALNGEHAFEPLLGDYLDDWATAEDLTSKIKNQALDGQYKLQHTNFPPARADVLTTEVISAVVQSARAIDALRQARLDLENVEA